MIEKIPRYHKLTLTSEDLVEPIVVERAKWSDYGGWWDCQDGEYSFISFSKRFLSKFGEATLYPRGDSDIACVKISKCILMIEDILPENDCSNCEFCFYHVENSKRNDICFHPSNKSGNSGVPNCECYKEYWEIQCNHEIEKGCGNCAHFCRDSTGVNRGFCDNIIGFIDFDKTCDAWVKKDKEKEALNENICMYCYHYSSKDIDGKAKCYHPLNESGKPKNEPYCNMFLDYRKKFRLKRGEK